MEMMKSLTIDNGEEKRSFEIADEIARETLGKLGGDYSLKAVTLEDIKKNMIWQLNDAGTSLGDEFYLHESTSNDHCTFRCDVEKDDMILFTNAHALTSSVPYILVVDENGVVTEKNTYENVKGNSEYIHSSSDVSRIGGAYVFKTSGTLYMSFVYTDVQAGEFFYLKRPRMSEPLILYENAAHVYEEDTSYGDAAMKAIMENRQIFVRLENVDGKRHTALYSPIYQYQLPNYQNNYLYLFYLKDAKQQLDLSALGMGTIEIPIYGELKLKLPDTYNQSPLL